MFVWRLSRCSPPQKYTVHSNVTIDGSILSFLKQKVTKSQSKCCTWQATTSLWLVSCVVSQTVFCRPPVCFSKHLYLFLVTHPFSTNVPPLRGAQVSGGYARWGQVRILPVCLLSEILHLCQVLETVAQTVQSHL